jgi:activating signal cointegrator 1
VKALTLWQPWASLVAMGAKTVETRIWSTGHRGELAIHSAANLPPKWLGTSQQLIEFRDALADVLNCRRDFDERMGLHVDEAVHKLPRGQILCIVRVRDVIPTEALGPEDLPQTERLFGNYELGRYAWFLEMVRRFDEPIPAKGNRRLWNWNEPPARRKRA